jgi:hypothetical protein
VSARVRKYDPKTNEPLYGRGFECTARGSQATQILLTCRFNLWAGTWPLDINQGFNWLAYLGTVPFQPALLEGAIKTLTLETPGVISVDFYNFTRGPKRAGTVQLTITDDKGNVIDNLSVQA